MNVLSLFDGKSSGYTAMELAGIPVTNYYSSEVDKYAIQVSNAIHPNQERLGDITKWREWDIDWASIDLILGGFPCQAWSMAGKQLGDKDERGMLFWVMIDIMKHVKNLNPNVQFLIENVKMKKEFEQYITHHMQEAVGVVHKTLINSALVSAQNRNRYYWTSFEVTQPEDKGIVLADIIEINPNSPTIMSERFCDRNSKILRDDVGGKAKNLSSMEYVKNGRQGDYINTEPTVDGETFEQWSSKAKKHGGSKDEFDSLVRCGRVVGRKINPETGKRDDYNPNLKTEQHVEPRLDDKSGCLTTVQKDNVVIMQRPRGNNSGGIKAENGKTPTLSANSWEHNNHLAFREKSKTVRSGGVGSPPGSRHNWDNALDSKVHYRKLTPRECFRLQTTPEHYIDKILNSGELYSHSQNFYNSLARLKVRGNKCKSVKSITVNSQSQVEKLNSAISTTLDSLDAELQKQLESLSIKASSVQKVGVSVTAKLQKGCVLSTIKHGSESTISHQESVQFALKTSEADGVECVLATQNQKQNMETRIRLTLTPEENSNLMGIKALNISKIQTVDGLIGLLQKRSLEENSTEERRYITLMAINLITARSIFLFANLMHNTYLCIDSLSQSQCNSLEVGIFTLKMENIKPTSNSALYKIAGNGWTDEVIAHIFRALVRPDTK